MQRRIDPARLDVAVAGVLFVFIELQAAFLHMSMTDRLVTALVGGAVTASVAIRRRFPTVVGIGVQLAMFATTPEQMPAGPLTIGWFCALYALAVWTTRTWFIVGLGVVIVTDLVPVNGDWSDFNTVLPFTVGAVVVMFLLRVVVGDRDRRLALASRERELASREAVVRERARIARELHDVIAHHVSMMVLQAGAERRIVAGDSETHEVLAGIERTGRGALTEMRRLVSMLRSDEDDERLPQPSVADIPMLVTQMREAGLRVDLTVTGESSGVPVGVGLSAYRIVQEALTNAVRHAGQARAEVQVHYGPDSIEVQVLDDGAGSATPAGAGGHGLVGMRERVALYGGTFAAGARPEGGFAVRALLPTRA
jgi:signal transduction histidine kinase